ncbi:LOW QUALITY PROTEIN: insulin-like receptor [Choristoneura fumiferana]|uniref:LOW QUALITY PROTEIN: insulin-like receptor n=1 Tax=Choristoneura fumiferana TaxID=7141 RepID=UPI003D15AD3F
MRRERGLAGPVTFLLLLACARVHAEISREICPSLDIRNSPENLHKLADCRVIEGQLSILLMERATDRQFENMSFPNLREVTGYIMIYRVKGIRNLGDLFPNLAVIRGMQLFNDFALVVFDNENLVSLGLRSLTHIEQGAVRIQHNDRLCYTNTIDWSKIATDGVDNGIIKSNYDTRLCGLCPNAQGRMDDHRQSHFQCPADASGRLLCWDDKHCQKVCPASCGNRSCTANGTCCNAACLGGCDGDQQHHCHVCRHYSVGYGTNRTCTETCPGHMYKLFRRCVTEQECREMPPPPPINYSRMRLEPNIQAYKILNDTCVYMCPNGYMEKGTKDNASCEKCPPSGCTRECTGGTINSAASAEKFRGCTTINGSLIIALRSSGGNIVSILESALSEVRVIYGVLKVVRSYPLVSLMSLKRLEKIVAIPGLHKGEALHIFNNPNLELLWDWEADPPKRLQITGKLFIHFNQKLCYNKQILPLRNMTVGTSFDEVEVSTDNNGDQALCYQETLDLRIQTLHKNFVILTWNTFCIDDTRQLLGYSIYYIAAEHNVTLYGQRDACSDTWNVLDIANDDVRNNTAIVKPGPGFPNDTCDSQQPVFHPVNHLIPFTRYAVYVKTYTTLQDKRGAQSPIKYFVTLPGRPSPPVGLTEESRTEHSVSVRWSPPTMPNGTIIAYHVEVQANSYNRLKIMGANVNYCTNPSLLANIIAVRGEDIAEKKEDKSGEVKNGSCECKEETRTYTKFDKIKEKERQESITFENELQNMVYVKQKNTTRGSNKNKRESRLRRSIDNSLSSMLVILSANNVPQVGVNHPNFTEENAKCSHRYDVCIITENDTGFISSLYYKLSGDARSLTVNNMRHFTWYTVSVWACRAQHANESDRDYADDWCSERAFYTFRTLELFQLSLV